CGGVRASTHPLSEAADEGVHDLLHLLQGLRPGTQQLVARRSQLVPALRRARLVGVPLGADEAVLLERPQDAVDAAQLGPLARNELGDAVDELVAVRGTLRGEEPQRPLEKA